MRLRRRWLLVYEAPCPVHRCTHQKILKRYRRRDHADFVRDRFESQRRTRYLAGDDEAGRYLFVVRDRDDYEGNR